MGKARLYRLVGICGFIILLLAIGYLCGTLDKTPDKDTMQTLSQAVERLEQKEEKLTQEFRSKKAEVQRLYDELRNKEEEYFQEDAVRYEYEDQRLYQEYTDAYYKYQKSYGECEEIAEERDDNFELLMAIRNILFLNR